MDPGLVVSTSAVPTVMIWSPAALRPIRRKPAQARHKSSLISETVVASSWLVLMLVRFGLVGVEDAFESQQWSWIVQKVEKAYHLQWRV